MKIAVTAMTPSLEGEIDPRFGRCPYFLIVDTETMEYQALENPAQQAFGGAGVQAAQFVSSQGVEAVISGHFGPNAYQALRAAGIKVYGGVFGSITDAIEKLKRGELVEVTEATVPPHFGMGGPGAGPGPWGPGASGPGWGGGRGWGGRGSGGPQGPTPPPNSRQ